MSWIDRLETASFRGMEFKTESHDTKLGRRLVVHEFPGAETPLIEDLGGKAAEIKLNAYFIGTDYDLQRNHFLLLLQKPGADFLIHPWLGKIEVRARDWSITESNEKGGYCTITVDFVPAGMVITQAMVDKADAAAAKLKTMADTAQKELPLSIMSTNAVSQFIATVSAKLDVLRNVLAVATLPLTISQQVIGFIHSIKSDFVALLAMPDNYVNAMRNVFDTLLTLDSGLIIPGSQTLLVDSDDIINGGLADKDRPRVVTLLTELATKYSINPGLLPQTVSSTSPLELPVNLEKDKLIQSVFLIATVGQLALAEYQSLEARDLSLNAVISAIDSVLPVLPDAVFQAACDARVAVIEALKAQDLDPTEEREVYQAMPATVLAHRFEIDENAFNALNHVRHPLFVSGVIHD